MFKVILKLSLFVLIMLHTSGCGGGDGGSNAGLQTATVSSDTTESNDIVEPSDTTEPPIVYNPKVVGDGSLKLEPIVIPIMPAGEKRTYQVHIHNLNGPVVYTLKENPSWISINSTGLMTFHAPVSSTESYSFKVMARVGDTQLESDFINGSVKKINVDVFSDLTNTLERNVEVLNAKVTSVINGLSYKVPNADGNTWDILKVYYKTYKEDVEIVIIDGVTGNIQHVKIPIGNWHLAEYVIAPNGKLYIISKINRPSQPLQPVVNIYDPQTNKLRLDVFTLPTEFYGSEVAPVEVGMDGHIYIGSSYQKSGSPDHGKLSFVDIDPSTETFTYSGPIGDAYAYSQGAWKIAADDTSTYVLGGKIPWTIVEYNRATKVSKTHAFSASSLNITQTQFGVFASVNGDQILSDGFYWLYKGNIIKNPDGKFGTPPWPIPAGVDIFGTLNSPKNIVEVNLPTEPDIVLTNAEALNGQAELWIKQPNQTAHVKYSYALDTYPIKSKRVIERSDGKIFGGVQTYGAYYTHENGIDTSIPGRISISLYTMLEHNNKMYITGYPSGTLYEYDFSKPWTQSIHINDPVNNTISMYDQSLNPRWVGKLGDASGAHKMYASAKDADGILYFGGRWMRDGSGGGLTIYNPEDDSMTGISDIFSNYQIRYMTSTSHGKYIAISTIPVTDATLGKKKASTGRVFIYNTQTKSIDESKSFDPVPETGGLGHIVGVDGPYVVGITKTDSPRVTYLYRYNIDTNRLDYKIALNDVYPALTLSGEENDGLSFRKGPKGKIWTFLNATLVKIDPISGDITSIARFKKPDYYWGVVGDIAFSESDIYLAGFENLIKLPGVLNE